jgi:hypothetical protein
MYKSSFDKILNNFYRNNIFNESEDQMDIGHSTELILIYNMFFGVIDVDKFKNEEFKKHLEKFLLTYNTTVASLDEVYVNLYCLAGFENDSKPFKDKSKIKTTSFGDNIYDSNNKYHAYWLNDFKNIQEPDLALQALYRIKPSQLSIAEVAIVKLFIRRIISFNNKLKIQERYLKGYTKEAIDRVLNDVGYDTEGYIKDVVNNGEKSYTNEIMRDAFLTFVDDIYRSANEAIKQLLASNRTSQNAPTIPGAPKFSAKENALKKYLKPGHTIVDSQYSTMATCKGGKLYIGPDFYFKEFKNNTNGLEYFKTIVAHEAMHQILMAFDDTDIKRLISPKYKNYITEYSKTYMMVQNIVKDMFLNSALEQWHFKIKDEWYTQFYFPKNGIKVLNFKVLADKKQELLKNKELSKFASASDAQGNLKIGIVAQVGKTIADYKFGKDVISYSDESECIAELFPLYVEDIKNNKENKENKEEKKDSDTMQEQDDSNGDGDGDGDGGGDGGGGDGGGDGDGDGDGGGGGDGGGDGDGDGGGDGDGDGDGDKKGKKNKKGGKKGKKSNSDEGDYWDKKKKEVDTLDEHDEEFEEDSEDDLQKPPDDDKSEDAGERGGGGASGGNGQHNKTKLDWGRFIPKQYSTELYTKLLDSFVKQAYTVKPKVQPSYINRVKSSEAGVRKNYTNIRQVRSNPDINAILVAVDTSASISKKMLLQFFTHIHNIIKLQDIKSGLITADGRLLGNAKEEDLFSIIPILWHDRAYYPNANDNIQSIKLNSLNFSRPDGIHKLLNNVHDGGTKMSPVAKLIQNIFNNNKNLKVGGLIYFTDMALYDENGIVVMPPNIPIKILSVLEPRTTYNFTGYSPGLFNPDGMSDIIWDNQTKWNDESDMNLKENFLKINGILYKDL